MRDLWTDKDVGRYTSSYNASVPAGGVELLTITGREGKATRYEAASRGNEFNGGALPAACPACFGGQSVAIGAEKSVSFENITSARRLAYVQIGYINARQTAIMAMLEVNGQDATNVDFPPTGNRDSVGAITVAVKLNPGSARNTVNISSPCSPGISLNYILVSSW